MLMSYVHSPAVALLKLKADDQLLPAHCELPELTVEVLGIPDERTAAVTQIGKSAQDDPDFLSPVGVQT